MDTSPSVILFLLLATFRQFCTAEENGKAKSYTVGNFAEELAKNNHFVMFYAPWCVFCEKLHPTWEELAEMLNNEDSRVTIAKVDCTKETSLCVENDVTGYPTLKFFIKGQKDGVKFRGTRDLSSLTNFINEHLESDDSESAAVNEVSSGLVELTDENYSKKLSSGSHFVKFYAPWCGHCQKLAPTWEALAFSNADDSTVTISKIDCTVQKDACKTFDIKSFPTLLWIQDGQKIDEYEGGRSLEELMTYFEEMKGEGIKPVEEKKKVEEAALESPVLQLSADNFKANTQKGLSFVKFYAPWCGHCKGLAPTWEELGLKMQAAGGAKVAKVDCTEEENKQLCTDQEVDGFPTLVLFRDGKRISEYSGNRSLEDLVDFLTRHILPHDEL